MDDIDAKEVTRMILYLEGAKYEHHQQCEECRQYGFEQGRALQEARTKWAEINVRLKR